ncbi:putative quinol monooxygenase [Chitinophaga nivalis]|uniref:Antibiotic biosynthesis monooxygenase n=1 Tax=Chitinophaga nivalis TaxID=2991709 RepID=A0ABT3IH41_9BACT|nr:antibiotic biosynthesis monooxygenase [Chitinophaga nivalis]MCW3467042.1 antibiotic biosynthesis monooxygenase [Chitinophaga nivalis]MCW3483267.1 antibiotic biosynthesis monooxygenase [Chitinophaga nivalis]
MVQKGLLLRLEAKPGKEAELDNFLKEGLAFVLEEPATISWYALQFGPSTFGIFDSFPDDQGRQAHITGALAQVLIAKIPDLLAVPPSVEKVDILVAKQP